MTRRKWLCSRIQSQPTPSAIEYALAVATHRLLGAEGDVKVAQEVGHRVALIIGGPRRHRLHTLAAVCAATTTTTPHIHA